MSSHNDRIGSLFSLLLVYIWCGSCLKVVSLLVIDESAIYPSKPPKLAHIDPDFEICRYFNVKMRFRNSTFHSEVVTLEYIEYVKRKNEALRHFFSMKRPRSEGVQPGFRGVMEGRESHRKNAIPLNLLTW